MDRSSGPAAMWMDGQRVLHCGPMGRPSPRGFGAWIVYVAMEPSLQLRVGTRCWAPCQSALLPPGVRHQVRGDGGCVATLLIEPETIDDGSLVDCLGTAEGVFASGPLPDRLRSLCRRLAFADDRLVDHEQIDHALFGRVLPRRGLDPRIERTVQRVSEQPAQPHPAESTARSMQLSTSRFLHLFKAETGVPFRSFRAWKRARTLLRHVNRPTHLTRLALDSGYADSANFSHSVRRVFGLSPTQLLAGWMQHHPVKLAQMAA